MLTKKIFAYMFDDMKLPPKKPENHMAHKQKTNVAVSIFCAVRGDEPIETYPESDCVVSPFAGANGINAEQCLSTGCRWPPC